MLLCKAKHFKYENISKLAETHYKNPKMNVLNRLDYLWAKKIPIKKGSDENQHLSTLPYSPLS